MISYMLMRLLQDKDREWKQVPGLELGLLSAAVEILWIFTLIYNNRTNFNNLSIKSMIVLLILVVIGSVYLTLIPLVDWETGYVYEISNILCLGVHIFFILLQMTSVDESVCGFSIILRENIFFLMDGIFFIVIVCICERMGGYARGDSEFLILSYVIMSIHITRNWTLAIMLWSMIVSSIIFGIFRKINGMKEVMVPYTPYIAFSEFIIINCFHRME
ncbi:MAG: hypothetical protein ACI4AQ_03845 [Lachnospiraceae bacterium]